MELNGPASNDSFLRYANFEPLDAGLNGRLRRYWAHVSKFKIILYLSGSFSYPNSPGCLMTTLGGIIPKCSELLGRCDGKLTEYLKLVLANAISRCCTLSLTLLDSIKF